MTDSAPEAVIEAMAYGLYVAATFEYSEKALAVDVGLNEWRIAHENLRGVYRHKARIALSAASRAGFVLVPVEITPDMQRAYFYVIDKNMERVETDVRFGRFASNAEAYRAMLAARPGATPTKQEGEI